MKRLNFLIRGMAKILVFSFFVSNFCILQGQDNYFSAYNTNAPTIDGQVNAPEWTNANSYDVVFTRNDGSYTKTADLFLQNDNTWLYIGVKTTIDAGWDVYLQLRFDGNNNHILDGNSSIPHTDIQIEHSSSGGWSGYTGYYYMNGTNTLAATAPSGTQWESNGYTNVNYEYKIKISDLGTSPGQTIGFYMLNGTDGTAGHNYEFPINGIRENPSEWCHIIIDEGVGIANTTKIPDIALYPNPTNGVIHISSSVDIEYVEVYDVNGKKIKMSKSHSNIDLSELNYGVYIINIYNKNNNKLTTKRILKSK